MKKQRGAFTLESRLEGTVYVYFARRAASRIGSPSSDKSLLVELHAMLYFVELIVILGDIP